MIDESGLKNTNDYNKNKNNKEENSNDDLMLAIRQVAKEMAEAVKLSQKQVLKEAVDDAVKNITDNTPYQPSEPRGERGVYRNTRYNNDDDFFNDSKGQKSFYEREIEAHNNLQTRLELLRNKKIADEMKIYKKKPELSNNTKKIIRNKLVNEKPIYDRADEVIKQRNEKLEMMKNAYRELELMEEMEHRSRFNYQGYVEKEVVQNFIHDQFQWLKNREEKMNFIKNEIEKLENEAEKTLYKPMISRASNNIAKTKINKVKERQVHSRLYNHHEENLMKKQILQIKEIPTFTPVINKNAPKFNKKEVEVRRTVTPNNFDRGNTTARSKLYNNKSINSDSYNNLNKNQPNNTNNTNNTKTKKERLNNSALEIYNNKNNFQEEEDFFEDGVKNFNYDDYFAYKEVNDDEDPLFAQYRLHLEKSHMSKSPVKDMFKNKTNMMKTVMINKIEEDRENGIDPDWNYELGKVNDRAKDKLPNTQEDKDKNNLYKLNVRNASPWNNQAENKVIATPKFSNMAKKLK